MVVISVFFFFFQAEDGIRYHCVTGVQTCALPILAWSRNENGGELSRYPSRTRCAALMADSVGLSPSLPPLLPLPWAEAAVASRLVASRLATSRLAASE